MDLEIKTLVAFYGYFPVYLDEPYSPNKGRPFSAIVLTIYHNLVKYLSLGLLITMVMVISPLMDYTSSLIKPTNPNNSPIYTLIVFNLISTVSTYFFAGYACRYRSKLMKWTDVFQILTKSRFSTKIDNSPDLEQNLTKFTQKMTSHCIFFIVGRALIIICILITLHFNQNSTLRLKIYGTSEFIQSIHLIVTTFYLVTFASLDHINSHLFEIMVEYFVRRFTAINHSIGIIVKPYKGPFRLEVNNQVKSSHETELRSVLDEHDLLKVNLKLYDKYWSSINMITLLIKPLVCLYCVYQLTFRVQTTESTLILWLYLIEAIYLFTRMFLSGTKVSDEIDAVAANGLRLILSNFSIPVLQRLQLFNQHIMFTEIGFSCGNLFTFTLDSVHDAFIELAQDFLLTLDFVITVRQAKSQLTK